ncbi:MAG: NAD-dependent epimerase/dehydratase family protein [Granulosicoccus sp.]
MLESAVQTLTQFQSQYNIYEGRKASINLRVLLIGGTALIGPHVIRELFENDIHDLHTINRSGRSYFCEKSHAADRRDQAELQRIIDEVKPDVLVDMIPFTAQDAKLVVSVLSNLSLDIPVIVISSIDVYSAYARLHRTEEVPIQICPLSEDMELRKSLGAEGEAYDKLSVELIYNENLENVCTLRLPAIYGWPDCTRVSDYLDQMLEGAKEIRLERHLGNWKFSRCFHKNAAHAITLSVLARLTGKHTYNVADECVLTERQWIQRIAASCGWNGSIVETSDVEGTIDWQQHFYVSTKKIRSELDFVDKYLAAEGIVDTVAYHAYQRTGATYQKNY